MKNNDRSTVNIPYRGHPIAALIKLHFVMTIRSLSAVFLNCVLVLPIIMLVLGENGVLPLLPDNVALIIYMIACAVLDMIIVGFREHDDNLFNYDFVSKYGNHKTVFFTVYEFFVFTFNLGIIVVSVYHFFKGGILNSLAAPAIGMLLPFVLTQFPVIRGIKEYACSKCKRANIMSVGQAGNTYTHYETDYKTVAGYDRKVGELSYRDNNIDIIQHVSRHKEFDGISRVQSRTDMLVCPICGHRKKLSHYSRTKVIK